MVTFIEEIPVLAPVVESKGGDWFLWTMGFLLGLLIELGSNTGQKWPCLGQPADVAEAVYFSYWYIRNYIENGYKTTNITYVAVYIARGWEAVMYGPCWEINRAEAKQRREEKRAAKEAERAAGEEGTVGEVVPGFETVTERKVEPPKNLTPEEMRMIDEATKLAKEFEGEMFLVETIFTTMKMLEILVDVANFYDL